MAKGKKVAYTPLTEKEKEEAMKQLIKNLHDPNHPAGNYRSPGGPTMDMGKMWPKVKKKDEDDLKIASAKRKKR